MNEQASEQRDQRFRRTCEGLKRPRPVHRSLNAVFQTDL